MTSGATEDRHPTGSDRAELLSASIPDPVAGVPLVSLPGSTSGPATIAKIDRARFLRLPSFMGLSE
jgi:hypothetical protein